MSFANQDERFAGPDPCPICGGWGFANDHEPGAESGQWVITPTACPACGGDGENHGD